jgi:SAM-dependent methyltransferase
MYRDILAEIHDRWFDSIPLAAAAHTKMILGDKVVERVVDLGCGSGVFLRAVQDHADSLFGVDISSEMIDRAKSKVPMSEFLVGDIFSVSIPPSDIIVFIGEILSYAAASDTFDRDKLKQLFIKVKRALKPGGLLLFDVLGDTHNYSGTFFHDYEEYTVISKVEQSEDIITRHIVSFLRDNMHYRKSVETHNLRVFSPLFIEGSLSEAGLLGKRIYSYNSMNMLPGRLAYECNLT